MKPAHRKHHKLFGYSLLAGCLLIGCAPANRDVGTIPSQTPMPTSVSQQTTSEATPTPLKIPEYDLFTVVVNPDQEVTEEFLQTLDVFNRYWTEVFRIQQEGGYTERPESLNQLMDGVVGEIADQEFLQQAEDGYFLAYIPDPAPIRVRESLDIAEGADYALEMCGDGTQLIYEYPDGAFEKGRSIQQIFSFKRQQTNNLKIVDSTLVGEQECDF